MKQLAIQYEAKVSKLRTQLDTTTDGLDRIKLSVQILTYQTVIADIYKAI